ncbi:MAG TPA: glutaredoxin [Saprospiraceae bacterium]|nr:glutaredoxin [Saprospiraceae bacterium]
MKTILSIFSFFLFISTGFTQKQDVEVFEKKEGNKVLVMARNTGKAEYSVTLTITSKGMDVTPSSKVETTIAAGFMKELATLVPRPGEGWEYSYDVTISQSVGKTSPNPGTSPTTATTSPAQTREENSTTPTTTKTTTTTITPAPAPPSPDLSKAEIILYTKPACGRCSYVKKQLTALNIPFEEYSTASTSAEINNMWTGLRNSGFTGGSVTMPVVRVKGKYYYNIKDMEGFVNDLKKS